MENLSFRNSIHQKIIANLKEVEQWFSEKTKGGSIPFYSSFDIRDSNFKAACVDANVFPAGFNNICEEDQKRASFLIKTYLNETYPHVQQILLLSEEHTRNFYYWDNVFVIKSLIEQAGYKVLVCVPGRHIKSSQKIITASGREIFVQLLNEVKGDLIISNNDFSVKSDLPSGTACNPPLKMGWYVRKKHQFFKEYNLLAGEFASLLKIDPWHLKVETELFSPFDMDSRENLLNLKSRSTLMLKALKKKQENLFKEEPYLFLKNNSGTYGLGIMNIYKSEDLDQFGYKARKKMKASKGETGVSEIIIQEGIPTALHSSDNQSAEPVIYMIGYQVAGGFLRSHKKKDHKTNLNSPGAVFRRLCMSDLEIKIQGLVMENVYSWLAKLGALALSREMEHLQS